MHARSSSRSICSGLTNCDQPLFHRLASAMGMSGLSRQEQMPQPDANYAPQTSNGTTTESTFPSPTCLLLLGPLVACRLIMMNSIRLGRYL